MSPRLARERVVAAPAAARAAPDASGLRDASESSSSVILALGELPVERQRFLLHLAAAIQDVAEESPMSEGEVRNVVAQVVESGLQRRQAEPARRAVHNALLSTLVGIDPVPHGTVEQARRLATLKSSLLRRKKYSTSDIAEGRGMTRDAARQWITRARHRNRIFTVSYEGETLVPGFLLNRTLEPRTNVRPVIATLRDAGEDGWSLWAWFEHPSPWLDGDVPARVLDEDPGRVAEAARRRAAAAE